MLWKIDNTNLHILGSVHVSNRPLSLSALATHVIGNASVLAFEANFDFGPNLKSVSYGKTNSLSKNIPASLFSSAKQLWHELELDEENLEGLLPWRVTFRLMNALIAKNGFIPEYGLDRKVLNFAKKERKKLYFLESIDAGLAPFAKAPATEQEKFLSKVVSDAERVVSEVSSLIVAWESGNPLMLLPIVEKAIALTPVMYTAALAGRNKNWLPHIVRLAKSQKNVVLVVGALHMVGPENIPSLLMTKGLTCQFVNETLISA